ncbi:hypothetical protein [Tenacibaculum singaporense]|uniref:Uncharacterized protein n=1 Tax=Tenacibaculum singaporense TaxID=2358479 RepID=A0A3S8R7X7_9FLAO|nr:hypothetical protein [Tenacibaculum singaporense]AZJ35794.1 hypothetical protein D6T69_09795 [Tenacibaculum singaporense]
MKKLTFIVYLFISSFQLFSQAQAEVRKENICKGAAISVVANVKPFIDNGFSKSEIIEMGKELVKDVIKDSPTKAYDLLKAKKSKSEVIEILYNDFMKLDEKVVLKFLLKPQPDDDD